MPKRGLDAIATAFWNLSLAPSRAPRRLERLAAACLQAEAEDSRLGDLSERYVRIHERARWYLGNTPWAMAASHLTADLHYLAATANVILFARAVDPVLRVAENATLSLVAADLRERTMTMLRVAAGKLVLPGLLLVGSALLVNSAVDAWSTWRQTEALMARLQLEKAEAAAIRIEEYLAAVRSQTGWTTYQKWAAAPLEQRRLDFLRLLRQVPAITEAAQLDVGGKEVLRVSRLSLDLVGSGADLARDVRFTEAQARGVYFSPVYFRKQSEPYMSLAMAHVNGTGVTLAEVSLKLLWDGIRAINFGETGYAYIVDSKGRLIAHRDVGLVLRQSDLSALPQVAAALAGPPSGKPVDGNWVDASLSGAPVVSVHAAVPTLGWRVFVELPVAEARVPLWSALIRVGCMLGLGLVAALLASLITTRRVTPVRPVPA